MSAIVEISDKELLALHAVAYGANTNKKLICGTFVRDVRNITEANQIEFAEAIETVYNLLAKIQEEVLNND